MASREGEAGRPPVALVTGATGITGRHCVEALLRRNEWRVVTLSRRPLDLQLGGEGERVQQVQADLMDKGKVGAALADAGAESVTNIFHCAYLMKGDPGEECEVNRAMLVNVVEGAEAAGACLAHVYCMEGGKWYGQHLRTELKTPHREDDPPVMPPMFYFDLQRYLEERVAGGADFTWSALRPNPVCGFSTGSFMNLSTSLAVYASISKELGLPLRFPGTAAAWESLLDVCDAGLLAEGMLHCATTPACANAAFNISNGDCFRWKDMWPHIAEWFGMETASPVTVPLAQIMADKGPVWERLVKRHGLQDTPYEQLATWQFADFVLTYPSSWFCNVNRLRRTGFAAMHLDSDAMFAALFQRMRDQKVIP